jgi:transposase
VLVRSRTQLINDARGTLKSFGHLLPKCSASSFHDKVADGIPELLREALEPILKTIASLSARIRDYDRKLQTLAQEHYQQTELLRQCLEVTAQMAPVRKREAAL